MTLDINALDIPSTQMEAPPLPKDIPPYVLVRDPNPFAAVGRAVGMLQPFPNFSLMPFGQINSLIIGAVNRGHYFYLLKDGHPAGFFAWAFADEAAAELWLEKQDGSQIGDGKQGDCVIFNVWHINSALEHDADVQKFLIRSFRELFADKQKLLARRVYANGRVKPIRMSSRKIQI